MTKGSTVLTIITEGFNTKLIKKALELNGIFDVDVLNDIEAMTGKNQLNTLFQFFAKIPHKNKVLFVWDCDVNPKLSPGNNTFPFMFPNNIENSITNVGIENAFPERLFADFITTTNDSRGNVKNAFDKSRKRDFEDFLLSRSNLSDFSHFTSLITEINRIKKL